MLTLYRARGAGSLAPHIVLEEIGVPYETREVVIHQGSRADVLVDAEYLAINPKGRIPALAIDDEVLTEAPAILCYLARRHPEAGLLPAEPLAETRCYEWMNFLATTVHAGAFSQIVRPQRFVSDEKDYPAVVARGREHIAAAYAYIEDRLNGRDTAVAGRFTIADAYLLFFYLSSQSAGNPMAARYPNWTRVSETALARPAVQRVLAKEGIAP
jgi:glutathione S-transferase